MIETVSRRAIIAVMVILMWAGMAYAEKLTPQMCKDKVIAAAKLIEEKGDDAIPLIKDEKGEFRFGEGQGYIWVHDLQGKMIMHPIKPALDGSFLLDTADPEGSLFFAVMNELVQKQGSGWVPYKWPKPGDTKVYQKISFVKLVKKGDKTYVVGAGMYDVGPDDIKKQFPSDAISE